MLQSFNIWNISKPSKWKACNKSPTTLSISAAITHEVIVRSLSLYMYYIHNLVNIKRGSPMLKALWMIGDETFVASLPSKKWRNKNFNQENIFLATTLGQDILPYWPRHSALWSVVWFCYQDFQNTCDDPSTCTLYACKKNLNSKLVLLPFWRLSAATPEWYVTTHHNTSTALAFCQWHGGCRWHIASHTDCPVWLPDNYWALTAWSEFWQICP